MDAGLNQLSSEGWDIKDKDLARLSSKRTFSYQAVLASI